MRTTIINCLKSYVKKYQSEEKSIENGSLLENPAMIGYFEAKDIISLQQRIDKAIEYIEKNSHKTEWGDLEQDNESIDINDDITDNDFIINLLSILKGEDKE